MFFACFLPWLLRDVSKIAKIKQTSSLCAICFFPRFGGNFGHISQQSRPKTCKKHFITLPATKRPDQKTMGRRCRGALLNDVKVTKKGGKRAQNGAFGSQKWSKSGPKWRPKGGMETHPKKNTQHVVLARFWAPFWRPKCSQNEAKNCLKNIPNNDTQKRGLPAPFLITKGSKIEAFFS